jgi:hypothetical protein
MGVEVIRLRDLVELTSQTDHVQFVAEHPGTYLVSMGILLGELAPREGERRSTISINFGPRLAHAAAGDHPLAGIVFRIPPGAPRVTFGRGVDCDVVLPDESVSDHHCLIEFVRDGMKVTDLGSKNGTTVNLMRVPQGVAFPLGDANVLTVGRQSFQVLSAARLYDELSVLRPK